MAWPILKENRVCPNAASQTSISRSADQLGLSNVAIPILDPGNVKAYTNITTMMMNSNGIKILDNLPIPLFTSLIDTAQKIPHNINVPIRVGSIIVVADAKFELPPT